MMQSTIDASALQFSAHCQVRYVERFLDKEAVRKARRLAKTDGGILKLLMPEFEDDLRHFRHVVQVAYFHLLHKIGRFVEGTAYRINLGPLVVCVEDGLCKTTISKHHDAPRPDPPDDDPWEAPPGSEAMLDAA